MATGLNFQTQTIINSNYDPDSKKLLFGVICNKKSPSKGEVVADATTATDDSAGKYGDKLGLYVGRDFWFYKDKKNVGKVLSIRKQKGYEGKMCKATINFTDLLSTIKLSDKINYCRLDIYLGVEGAEPYIYSTPWVQKGMPFWVEFTVTPTDTADTIAKKLEKMIKQNHIFLCDKDLLKVSVVTDDSGEDNRDTKLVLEGTADYQRFKKIEISSFEADAEYANVVASIDGTNIKIVEPGENAFGTYSQITKDLRLPTAANYQWTHIRQVETPIVGAIYDQYIIEYCGPAVNDGLHAVGQRYETTTTHVFWVKNDTALIGEWKKALAFIDPDGNSLDAENVAKTIEERVSELEKGAGD